MNLVRTPLLFLFTILILTACQDSSNKKEDQNDFVLIALSENEEDSAQLMLPDTTYTVYAVNDSFVFQFPLQKRQMGKFVLGEVREHVFAQPTDTIIMMIEGKEVSFRGSMAPLYIKMEELSEKYGEVTQFEDYRDLYRLPKDSFLHLIYFNLDELETEIDTSLHKPFDDWSYDLWSKLSNNWAFYAIIYPVMHQRFTDDTLFTVGPEYYKEVIQKFSLNDLSLLKQPERKELLKNLVEYKFRMDTSYIKSDSARLRQLFAVSDSLFEKDTLTTIANQLIVLEQLKYQGYGDAELMIKEFTARVDDSIMKKEFYKKMAEWDKLKKGEMAPVFAASLPDSSIVSLSDLKGKVVYLDIWATWCGPCLQEVPHLEKMYERYDANEDVALVSVSIDADRQKWLNMIDEKEMGGMQLWIPDAWNSSLNKEYLINSIPRFILIDKDGKIVDADAPRPSSKEEIYGLIDQQL